MHFDILANACIFCLNFGQYLQDDLQMLIYGL